MICAESGLIAAAGIAVPAGYVTPVSGFLTGTTRIPLISFWVGSVYTYRGFSVWRNPS